MKKPFVTLPCKFKLLSVLPLFLLVSINANAATFCDDFDDRGWTNAHWDIVYPEWDFVQLNGSDWGYQGIRQAEESVAASIADNGAIYYNANISLRVDLKIDDCTACQTSENIAGLLFSLYGSELEGFSGYHIDIQIDYDGTTELTLNIGEIDGLESSLNIPSLSLGTWYTLIVQTDSDETIDVYLYDNYPSSPPIGSITGISPSLPAHSGKVGVSCNTQATFKNFCVRTTKAMPWIPLLLLDD